MTDRKMPRLDNSAPHTTSRLIRHWHIIREPLLPFLGTPDMIALLRTHHELQDDVAIDQRVFDETEEYAAHFALGCPSDWCAPVRVFDYEHPDSDRCFDYHITAGLEKDRIYNVPRPTSLAEMMQVWQSKLGSRERCLSLLSLANLMATELGELLYSRETPGIMWFTIVPFILPLSRLDEIARINAPSGPATDLGGHFENLTGDEGGKEVRCSLCTACVSTAREAEEYEARRGQEDEAFYQRLRDDGYESDSSEYEARADEHESRRAELDKFYDEERFLHNFCTIIADRCKEGTLPPLQLVGAMTRDDLDNAVDGDYYGGTDDNRAFCKNKLRPLVAFFRRNGFGPVHRAVLSRDQFETVEPRDKAQIRRVEMVGAEAPHGFFAGVYYVAW